MASGVQLATAYISLNVNTGDVKDQIRKSFRAAGTEGRAAGIAMGTNLAAGMRGALGRGTSIFAPLQSGALAWAASAGVAVGSALKKAISGAVKGAAGGAALTLPVLLPGLERLKTIQRAQVQLSLKLSPQEIKRVTDDITEVVTGTPIALDEALQAVPRALSAGIKPGKELSQYVKDIADAAASTGGQAGFGRVELIFSQILAKGKLTGEEMMQLAEAGVDVRSALKDAFGWDDKQLQRNLEKGKVGMKEIQAAIQNSFGRNGGLSKMMGNTFDGAIGNLKASVARLGANILGVIFGNPDDPNDPLRGAIDGITSLTGKLDTAGKWVKDNREEIRGYFEGAKNSASKVVDVVKDLWDWLGRAKDTAFDVGSKIGSGFDTAKRSLDGFINRIQDIWTNLKKWVLDKWDNVFGPNSAIGKFMRELGFGTATANASPGSPAPGAAPFNPGPMAPGRFGNYPSRRGLPPGTRLDGSDQGLSAVPQSNIPGAAITPGSYPGDSALLSKVPAGRYVSLPGVGDLTQGIGDCTSAIEDLINIIEGRPTGGRSMATGNAEEWLTKQGFVETDTPMPGTFQIGFFNDPNAPGGGHMQATLPDGTKFNWGDDASAANRGIGTSGAWDDPRFNRHFYKPYRRGGRVFGAGGGTTDAIPAMLSNGEHVLTADDVKKMGGQGGVYSFRQALQNGLIPGFAPGGAVDDTTLQDLNNQLTDLRSQRGVAYQQLEETLANEDATDYQKLQARIAADAADRAYTNAATDFPIIAAGGTPPDRSLRDRVFSTGDALALQQAQMNDLRRRQSEGEEIPASQVMAMEAALATAQRDRLQAEQALRKQNEPVNFLDEFQRTAGFIPTAAGNTGVAGTSSLSSLIGMGNEVVGGLIDTGASLLQTAAQAGITAGTLGSGAAAAPAAGAAAAYGIQAGAAVAKRLSSFGFQLASIGADSLVEQLFPLGAPRWIGYDYTQFAPNLNIMGAATSTLEKMGNQAIQRYFNPSEGTGIPAVPSGPAAASGPDRPQLNRMTATGEPGVSGQIGAGPNTPLTPNPPPPPQVVDSPPPPTGGGGAGGGSGGGGSWIMNPLNMFGRANGGHIGIYDNGGILKPGELALNASRTPENILTKQQWNAMAQNASTNREAAPLVKIDTIYGMNPDDVAQKIESKQKLAMMRYAGRP